MNSRDSEILSRVEALVNRLHDVDIGKDITCLQILFAKEYLLKSSCVQQGVCVDDDDDDDDDVRNKRIGYLTTTPSPGHPH